jgi:hypothetical protein
MMTAGFPLGSSRLDWSELGQYAEVLDRCGHVELVFGSVRSSAAEAVEADDALELRE